MQQRSAPERCRSKFSEPYRLKEGEVVARFLQVNLRKDDSHTLRTAAATRESERERERKTESERERGSGGARGREGRDNGGWGTGAWQDNGKHGMPPGLLGRLR